MDNFYLILKMWNSKNIKITDFQCLDIGNIHMGICWQLEIENDIRNQKVKWWNTFIFNQLNISV